MSKRLRNCGALLLVDALIQDATWNLSILLLVVGEDFRLVEAFTTGWLFVECCDDSLLRAGGHISRGAFNSPECPHTYSRQSS